MSELIYKTGYVISTTATTTLENNCLAVNTVPSQDCLKSTVQMDRFLPRFAGNRHVLAILSLSGSVKKESARCDNDSCGTQQHSGIPKGFLFGQQGESADDEGDF